MSIYNLIYASTSDYGVTSSDNTYATARSGSGLVAGGTGASDAKAGQDLLGGATYSIGQAYVEFDTSAVSGTPTGSTCSVKNTAASGAGKTFEARVSAWTSGTASWVAGASLSALSLFASGTGVSAARCTLTGSATGYTQTSSFKLLICGADQTNNVAPVANNESILCVSADAAGTTDDPYIILTIGSAWALVGVSNVVEVTTASHALVTTGISGLASGDLLVACISSRIASATQITLPTGGAWTRVNSAENNNTATNTSATPTGFMAYAIRGGSDPNLTFTHPTTPSVALGVILAYRNVNASTPLDTSNAVTSGTNVTAINVAAGVTTAEDDELLVCLRAGGQESTMTVWAAATDPTTASGATTTTGDPAPNAWTERVDSTTVTGADTALSVFDAVKTAAGATGNMTGTASQGSAHVVVTGAFKIVAAAATFIAKSYITTQAVQRAAFW